MTAGIATNRPTAVVTRASEMPPATAASPVAFSLAMPLKAFRMPTTVPNSPTKGAVEPIVAKPPKPRFSSAWTIASVRSSARFEAIVHAELKRGLGGLATIGSTAPFVGLFGTVVGILNAFNGIAKEKATGLAAVAGGISEALVTTAVGLFVAIPAVMMFNYLTGRVEAFDVEMDNSSSELIDYFLKRRSMRRS